MAMGWRGEGKLVVGVGGDRVEGEKVEKRGWGGDGVCLLG